MLDDNLQDDGCKPTIRLSRGTDLLLSRDQIVDRLMKARDDGRLNEIVEEVSEVYDVPICMVSLVHTKQLHFKVRVGLETTGCPHPPPGQGFNFCQHACERDTPTIVASALLDPRFQENPLVKNPPNIDFYVGAPLKFVGDGSSCYIGTLCIIDSKPRPNFSLDETVFLKRKATEVVGILQELFEDDHAPNEEGKFEEGKFEERKDRK